MFAPTTTLTTTPTTIATATCGITIKGVVGSHKLSRHRGARDNREDFRMATLVATCGSQQVGRGEGESCVCMYVRPKLLP